MKRKPLKKLNIKHQVFIKEMFEHGNRSKAYQKAYPGTTAESADAAASRLMAQPIIIAQVANLFDEIREGIKTIKAAEVREKLQNYIGIRDALGDIITGNRKFEKLYKVRDAVVPFTKDAEASEVLRALDINLKVLKMLPEKMPKFIRRIALENKTTQDIKEVR